MRILTIGQLCDYPEWGFGGVQAFLARDLELSHSFAKLGHTSHLLSTRDGAIRGGAVQLVRWGSVDVPGYDAIVLSEFLAHAWVVEGPCAQAVMQHPRVVAHLDALATYHFGGPEVLKYCKAIGVGYDRAAVQLRRILPGTDVFLLPWGYMDIPPQSDPWEGKPKPRPRVVYLGAVQHRFLDTLRRLGEMGAYEIWAGGTFSYGGRPGWGALLPEEARQIFRDKVHLITEIIPCPIADAVGAYAYGTHFGVYQHADVCLNLMSMGTPWTYNSKVYDILSCGCPIVSEEGSVNNGDILYLGAGEIVPQDAHEALCAGIDRVLSRRWDREDLAERAKLLGTWTDRARVLLSHML